MTLLEKLYHAVHNNIVNEPFTTSDIKAWINNYNITNDDNQNKPYSNSYIDSFASSSVVNSSSTKSDKKLTIVSNNDPKTYKFI